MAFQGMSFGPMQLRPLLREELEQDEHVVGWGVGGSARVSLMPMLLGVMHMVPGIGWVVALIMAQAMRDRTRFFVLSTRRLLVVHPGWKPAKGDVRLDRIRIEHLGVVRIGTRTPLAERPLWSGKAGKETKPAPAAGITFQLSDSTRPAWRPPVYRIGPDQQAAGEKLVAALGMLASDTVSP